MKEDKEDFRVFRTFWAPASERSNLLSIYVAGASFGSVVVFPLSGVLADAVGWRYGRIYSKVIKNLKKYTK